MIRIRQLKLPVEHSRRDLEQKIIKTLRIRPEELIRYELIRRSLDARGGELKYVYMIDAEVKREPTVLKHCNGHAEKAVKTWYQFPKASADAKKYRQDRSSSVQDLQDCSAAGCLQKQAMHRWF